MMNTQNVGSQESLGIKYVDGMYAEFCIKVLFENDWHFCNINELRWFQMQSKNKVPNNHFTKLVQKQPYLDVLQNRCS